MVANTLRWTIQDLDAMPDDGGWKRYEIIDGELYVTRAPHIRHQGVVCRFQRSVLFMFYLDIFLSRLR